MTMSCFYGEDATLQYMYECSACGTVVVVDFSDPQCLENWDCPKCNPVECFPWKNFTTEQLKENNGALQKWFDLHKKMGKDMDEPQPEGSLEIFGMSDEA